jgi:hypothetical protein
VVRRVGSYPEGKKGELIRRKEEAEGRRVSNSEFGGRRKREQRQNLLERKDLQGTLHHLEQHLEGGLRRYKHKLHQGLGRADYRVSWELEEERRLATTG